MALGLPGGRRRRGGVSGQIASWDAAVYRSDDLDPQIARYAFDLGNLSFANGWVATGALAICAGSILITHRALPSWLGWWALGLRGGSVLARAVWTEVYAMAPVAAFWLWTAVVSVWLIRWRARRTVHLSSRMRQGVAMTYAVEWARRVALGVVAGAVAGLVAGGIGGRLFMSALAARNPQAAGVRSDDGFTIGQVTLSGTLNLLFVTAVIGAVSGPVWVAVRGLRFGPGWWRAVSMPLAATLVIGDQMVHADSVDFTLLEPTALAVGFTLAVPALATVVVTALGDRWIGSDVTVWQSLPSRRRLDDARRHHRGRRARCGQPGRGPEADPLAGPPGTGRLPRTCPERSAPLYRGGDGVQIPRPLHPRHPEEASMSSARILRTIACASTLAVTAGIVSLAGTA